MKLVKLTFLLLIAVFSNTLIFHSRKVDKSNTKLDLASNLAKIAHDMAYGKTSTELDYFIEGGIVGENTFKASYGTLASDPTVAVLVFRGTVLDDLNNMKANVKTKQVSLTSKDFKPCSKCLVHEGFRDAYKNNLRPTLRTKFSPFIINRFNSKKAEEKITSVYFIGHSLGGALATLAAYDSGVYLASQKITGIKLGLVTFGAPRVGNADFAKYINESLGLSINIRITYRDDPIISVPWEDAYVHCGSEYKFTSEKLYGNGPSNEDKSPRVKGAWDLVYEYIKNGKDHSFYSQLDDKAIVDIISKTKKSFKKLK